MFRFSVKMTAICFLFSMFAGAVCAEPPDQTEPTSTLVYTVREIPAKTTLTKAMFREEVVLQRKVPQAAASRIFELEGRIAQFNLPKGALVFTRFASGLYAPKGNSDYKDPIPCIYDTSTNTWSLKEVWKQSQANTIRKHSEKNRATDSVSGSKR